MATQTQRQSIHAEPRVPGLVIVRNLLDADDCDGLLATVDESRSEAEAQRAAVAIANANVGSDQVDDAQPTKEHAYLDQMMHFGQLPWFATWAADRVAMVLPQVIAALQNEHRNESVRQDQEITAQEAQQADVNTTNMTRELELQRLATRSPLFNQLILNVYSPGKGIRPHVDLLQFDDLVVSLSLGAPTVMTFKPISGDASLELWQQHWARERAAGHLVPPERSGTPASVEAFCNTFPHMPEETAVDVWLAPGDLVVLVGPARWRWTHEIAFRDADPLESGELLPRGFRTSITLRALRDWTGQN
ncbi:hypothetical protein CAOG_08040 [Capsaspora owczarzaki ATCC 30864]|uniref:Fe2OG dioxygenase domain-containing protein n=1 Tax=Capsaspora owczarzaki (strain ATCC 30864) TaxID=595528 RepID=A0A0D2W145_CAPO3|nr:hypothetical protein CAOG_08040 [Capsaspora owczarzaki ATCC 30864]KJE97982.1 hypothetical protein CAOG_008040 [Capsaspora owczarzaki ATCC 30864]|eukprot:XP_004342641.1 hypothetical protein CAOG_08040 [Capsaspora owczarzaki ATCC 30864]